MEEEEEDPFENRPKTEEEAHIEDALGGRISAKGVVKRPPKSTDLTSEADVALTVHGQHMPRPEPMAGMPPGLEYLVDLDELLIQQEVHLIEALTCWDLGNKYQITNNLGQQVFVAMEDEISWIPKCCRSQKGFEIHITDNFGQEVIRVTHEFKCCVGCCWWQSDQDRFGYEIQVEAPVETVCGYVTQLTSKWRPRYMIRGPDGSDMFYMQGPAGLTSGSCGCFSAQEFTIFTPNKAELVAVISKQWSSFVQELCADADSFRATFPMNLDVRVKAMILATAFLIDFMYY